MRLSLIRWCCNKAYLEFSDVMTTMKQCLKEFFKW